MSEGESGICGETTHRGKTCQNDPNECPHHGTGTEYKNKQKRYSKLKKLRKDGGKTQANSKQQVKQRILETVEKEIDKKLDAAVENDELFVRFDARLYNTNSQKFRGELNRNDAAVKGWREKILERDNYECQECGGTSNLHAHHIKSWSEHPELRLKLSNGITLCDSCHEQKHNLKVIKSNQD